MRDTGVLDEAYERFARTGPEFGGYLSNHGPMAVEAMVRHGHGGSVHRWVDAYVRRLEDAPRGLAPVTEEDWREALGDVRRVADWTAYFTRELDGREWRTVLARWWPRLLPGIVAGATHGVIRVGHAVRTLLEAAEQPRPGDPRVVELAHALAYWAARWQPVAGDASVRTGRLRPAAALAAVPPVADQSRGIAHRVPQLATTAGWPDALGRLAPAATPEEARGLLAELADAATVHYLAHGHGDAVMLVHSATAPTAVLRTLPALPPSLWAPGLAAAWAATAAVTAAYRPRAAAPASALRALTSPRPDPADVLSRAVAHGDEHAIKFADTALDAHTRTHDPRTLAAALRATHLIPPSRR
ncbi:questin oxidase family protein [Streptomyces sp. NPDC060194]|uniref:questin oxidase family protein n=1 Tax=Streptomyces sp. NPDC060194 TaxID=3347069 RepID=UPI003660A89D